MFVQAVRRAAQIRGDQPATICGIRRSTWSEFETRTARLAHAFAALGVVPGDRIGVLSLNSDRYLEIIHAVWWRGAVIVPMNIRWALNEHLYSIDDSGIRLFLADDAHLELATQVRAQRPVIGTIIYTGDRATPAGYLGYEELIDAASPAEPTNTRIDELAGIFYTGGTTGHPKGVMHSSLSLWAGATNLAFDVRVPLPHPRYIHAAPMFHLGDLQQAFGITALAGTHVIVPGFTPQGVAEAVHEHRVETTLLVPTMIGMLLDAPGFKSSDFDSLRLLVFGGSPISGTLLARVRSAFPNARLVQGFGQTETASCGAILHYAETSLDAAQSRKGSAGRALYGCELGIFDEHGARQPAGVTGEIWIHTASAMMGYWNKPEQSAAALTDGWVHTGDAGYVDNDGYVYICDRVKDMIISGGENIFSAEVENAIVSHPSVSQVAVIGIPDARWGESVHAVIVCRPGMRVTLEEVQAHCRPLIAGYKVPRGLEIRESPLPLSAVGKVLKTVLRAPYWEHEGRNVN
jgi:long-chain acyl-CoA synthetase